MDIGLGSKVCVIGPSSSGKSTLGKNIALKMGAPCAHLDMMAHIPNTKWVRCPLDEFINKHDEFIKQDSWVVEGNYNKCMPKRFDAADTIIWLKFSPIKCAYYYIKRSFFDKKERVGKLQGSGREWSWDLLKYILLGYPKKIKKYEEELKKFKGNIFIIKNYKERAEFYKKYL